MNTCTFNCSSVVRSTSFNNVSNYCTAKQQNFKINNQDKTILLPTVVSSIINTISSNLATTVLVLHWTINNTIQLLIRILLHSLVSFTK